MESVMMLQTPGGLMLVIPLSAHFSVSVSVTSHVQGGAGGILCWDNPRQKHDTCVAGVHNLCSVQGVLSRVLYLLRYCVLVHVTFK